MRTILLSFLMSIGIFGISQNVHNYNSDTLIGKGCFTQNFEVSENARAGQVLVYKISGILDGYFELLRYDINTFPGEDFGKRIWVPIMKHDLHNYGSSFMYLREHDLIPGKYRVEYTSKNNLCLSRIKVVIIDWAAIRSYD